MSPPRQKVGLLTTCYISSGLPQLGTLSYSANPLHKSPPCQGTTVYETRTQTHGAHADSAHHVNTERCLWPKKLVSSANLLVCKECKIKSQSDNTIYANIHSYDSRI